MSETAIYAVIAWLPAEIEQDYVAWLDHGHLAEVASQPGFLSGRRVKLNQTDSDGRQGYMSLYEVKDQASLDTYLNSETRQKFIAQGQKFVGVRMERLDGLVVATA